jgi:hypothetical protein
MVSVQPNPDSFATTIGFNRVPFFTTCSFPFYSTTTMMVGQKNPGSNFLVEFAFVARVVALKSLI